MVGGMSGGDMPQSGGCPGGNVPHSHLMRREHNSEINFLFLIVIKNIIAIKKCRTTLPKQRCLRISTSP